MKEGLPWYEIKDIDKIDSPALAIYLERVKHNIALAIEMVGDAARLRPHVKTHKSENVTQLMMQAGITKFKCATIAEAEMVARCGASDVLLAYQPVGPKTHRFISLMREFPHIHFSCLIDHIEPATALANTAKSFHLEVNAFIDLNIGMNRSGVSPTSVLKLCKECQLLEGLQIVGLHAYDGHITASDLKFRTQQAVDVMKTVTEAQQLLAAVVVNQPVIVIGGSPTFPIYAQKEEVECSPGTFVYWDHSYNTAFPDMAFQPAVLVICRVVSIINETTLCLDLGHKSIAAENALPQRVYFLNEPSATIIGQSEEHLVIKLSANHSYKIGDVFYGVPFHVCPTCALYDTTTVVENKMVKEEWFVAARRRRISI